MHQNTSNLNYITLPRVENRALHSQESNIEEQRPKMDFMSKKSSPRGLKSIPLDLMTTFKVPNLTPQQLKSTP